LTAFLEQRGVAPGASNNRYGAEGFGPSIYINDPEGNRVELKAGVAEDGNA
jgi:glyoxylase I family protein